MALNLSNVFFTTDSVLNNLLGKYVSLQFIGFNQSEDNAPYYLLDNPITSGFYHQEKRVPNTGESVETLRIVPQTDEIGQLLSSRKVKMFELTDQDGNFVRFTLRALKEPHPPKYEWMYQVTPNKQEQTTIT